MILGKLSQLIILFDNFYYACSLTENFQYNNYKNMYTVSKEHYCDST